MLYELKYGYKEYEIFAEKTMELAKKSLLWKVEVWPTYFTLI